MIEIGCTSASAVLSGCKWPQHTVDYDQSARTACGTRIPVDGIDDVFKAALVPHIAPPSALYNESLIS